MSEKKQKVFWYLIGIGFAILFVLILVSSIINIGEKLRDISQYLEWGFYALAAILVFFLVINPLRIVLFSPSLSIVTTLDKDSHKARVTYKKVAKNIVKNNVEILTEEEKKAITSFKNADEMKLALNLCLNGTIKKQIRKLIVRNAKTVMISTAISQNAKVDMFATIAINLRLIKEIVLACGFRPSMKNLSKLTARVGTTALIADGMESLKLEDLLPQGTINSISNIPLLKPLLTSVTQGLVNALLTIRIGLVTRGYLFSDSYSVDKEQIRIKAFGEALVILPIVLTEVLTFFPKKIVNLFSKKNREDNNDDNKKIETGELVD